VIPIFGLDRVVRVRDAPEHAQERRLVGPLRQHLVVTLQRVGELRDAEAPVHHVEKQQSVRLARSIDELDRVRDAPANDVFGQ